MTRNSRNHGQRRSRNHPRRRSRSRSVQPSNQPCIYCDETLDIIRTREPKVVTRDVPRNLFLDGKCRFFLDTDDEDKLNALLRIGLFRGFSITLPSRDLSWSDFFSPGNKLISSKYEIMISTIGSTVDEMFDTGSNLAALDKKRIIIKVPATTMGIEVAARLIEMNIRVCLTDLSCSEQALVAATLGVDYVVLPYCDRVTDIEMREILSGLVSKTRILVPNPCTLSEVATFARVGIDSFTLSPNVARLLCGDYRSASSINTMKRLEPSP